MGWPEKKKRELASHCEWLAHKAFLIACKLTQIKSTLNLQVAFISRGKEVGEMGLIGNFARLRTASMVAHYDCEESTSSCKLWLIAIVKCSF
jgi:hypothetical protein